MNKKNYRVEDIAAFITDDPDIMNEFMLTDMPTSMPAAPTAPPMPKTEPKTPPTTKPSTPMRPHRAPGVKPAKEPRAEGEEIEIFEAYEQFPDQSMRDLHTPGHKSQKKIGFMQTPLVAEHGAELAKKAYQYSDDAVSKTHPEFRGQPAQQKRQMLSNLAMNAYMQMMRLERPHHRELEQIAIDAVAKLYNISDEDKNLLYAKLQKPIPLPAEEGEEEETEEIADHESPEELKHHINKRYMLNMLSQGASIHNQWDGHLQEEIIDRITALDPKLAAIYTSFGRTSSHHYWIHNLSSLLRQTANESFGLTQVTTRDRVPEDEDQKENEEEFDFGTPDTDDESASEIGEVEDSSKDWVVYAQAAVFPVLIQELVKGVIMLVSEHQFEDEKSQAIKHKVMGITDTLRDEVPGIHLGPVMWKVLVLCIPDTHRREILAVLMKLAKSDHILFANIFSDLGHIAKTTDLNDKVSVAEIRNSNVAKTLITLMAEEQNIQPAGEEEGDFGPTNDEDEHVDDEFESGEPDEGEYDDDDVGGDDEDPYNNY